jgi:hypothetical protein
MKPLIITAAVAVAALGGVGGTLVAASWPDGPANHPAAPIALAAPAAADAPAEPATGAADRTTVDGAGAAVRAGTRADTAAATTTGTAAGSGAAESTRPTAGGTTQADPGAPDEPTGPTEPTCGLRRWDARVQGRPAGFSGGDRAGDYLWHDATGFHLRVTHRGDRKDVFTGAISADRPLVLRPVRLEGRDAVALSADRRTVFFRFYDYGHVDGVDFTTDCASRLVLSDLRVDAYRLGSGRVYLGRTGAHPAGIPVTLTRAAS